MKNFFLLILIFLINSNIFSQVARSIEAESSVITNHFVTVNGTRIPYSATAGTLPVLNVNFGDLNADNNVNVLDVIVTVNYLIGHIDLNTNQLQNGDMNLDGVIDILDVLMIVDSVLSN